jgi:hypothetical protein
MSVGSAIISRFSPFFKSFSSFFKFRSDALLLRCSIRDEKTSQTARG